MCSVFLIGLLTFVQNQKKMVTRGKFVNVSERMWDGCENYISESQRLVHDPGGLGCNLDDAIQAFNMAGYHYTGG